MTRQLFANNAESTLSLAVAPAALSIVLQPGGGADFPVPAPGDYFLATLSNGPVETIREIVKIIDNTTDVLTVEGGGRAQEGTSDLGWGIGTTVSARLTAASLEAFFRNDEIIEEEINTAVSDGGGNLEFDMALGNNFDVELFENVTAITFVNFPAGGKVVPIFIEFTQDALGPWTVAGWPAAVKWPFGVAPAVTPAINAVDTITGFTRDDGVSIRLGLAMGDSK